MSTSVAPVQLETTYDGFLFAVVRDDMTGVPVTVLSMLARLNIDPWREAAALSQMSKQTASLRIVSMIEELPGLLSTSDQTKKIADRLILLSPKGSASAIGPLGNARARSPETTHALVIRLLIMLGLFGVLWAANHVPSQMAGLTQSSTSVDPMSSNGQ